MNLFDAAKSYGQGQLDALKFDLQAYKINAAGIGEHGKLMEEVVRIIKEIAEWEDYLEMVEKLRHDKK